MPDNTPPESHHTNPGKTAQDAEWSGSEQVIGTDTDIFTPKDDTPWALKKKSGPVSGTVSPESSAGKPIKGA